MNSPAFVASKFRSALNASFHRAVTGLARAVDRLGAYRGSLRVAFWILLTLVSIGAVLDYGTWQREEVSSGPFRTAARFSDQYAVGVSTAAAGWFRIRLVDDGPAGLPPPGIQLTQSGRAVTLPTEPRPQVSLGQRSSFGAQRELTFALPDGVANDDRLRISARYVLTYHRTINDILLTCFILVVAVRLFAARRRFEPFLRPSEETEPARDGPQWKLGTATGAALMLFPLLSMLVIAGCIGYAGTIGYGVVAGHALPTAAAFYLLPRGLLSGIEPYFPVAILTFAAAGTMLAWGANFHTLPAEPIRELEQRLARIWRWWGLPVILCLFLISLSAGGWSGHIRPQDSNYLSIATLAPHSDARAYFTDAYRAALFGDWDILGSRRPMGQAFRQLTVMAVGSSYVGTLLIQLFLVATTLFVAARFVAGRSGIWAGIAFVGLIYLIARPFLYTTMTEPLGLIWAMLSIVFFLEAFRLKSLAHALVGFAVLTVALLTRMGSMFTIPILALWLAWGFATAWRERLKIFAGACAIVAGALAVNALLAYFYSSPFVATGSNFAFSICGLSLAGDWAECSRIYASQLQALPDERAQAAFLFTVTWQNIVNQPAVLLARLVENTFDFIRKLPEFLLTGYLGAYEISGAITKLVTLALATSLLVLYRVRGTRLEGTFWALIFVSCAMSAAVIMADDGWRALHVTNALIACFFAAGFSAPGVTALRSSAPSLGWRRGAAAIAGIGSLFVVGPGVSQALMSGEPGTYAPPGSTRPDENIVPSGRWITGFQVISDSPTRPLNIPTLFVSEFVHLVRMSNLEIDFGPFVDVALQRVPFALIVTGRLDNLDQSNIYLAPVKMLEQQDGIAAWRLQVRQAPPGGKPWNVLREVVSAEPIRVRNRE